MNGELKLAETEDFSSTPEGKSLEAAWPGAVRFTASDTLVGAVDCIDEYAVEIVAEAEARGDAAPDFRETMLKDLRDLWDRTMVAARHNNAEWDPDYFRHHAHALCEIAHTAMMLENHRPLSWPMYRPWTPGTEGGGAT